MFFFRVVDAACQNKTQHNALGATHDVLGAAGEKCKRTAITTSHTLTPTLSLRPISPSEDCHDTPHATTNTLPKPAGGRDSSRFRSRRPTRAGGRKRCPLHPPRRRRQHPILPPATYPGRPQEARSAAPPTILGPSTYGSPPPPSAPASPYPNGPPPRATSTVGREGGTRGTTASSGTVHGARPGRAAHACEDQPTVRPATNQGGTRTPGDHAPGNFIRIACSIAAYPGQHNTTQHMQSMSHLKLCHHHANPSWEAHSCRRAPGGDHVCGDTHNAARFLDSMDIERERGITIHTELRLKRRQGQGWRDVLVEPGGYPRACRFLVQGVRLNGRL